jgi:hypothetical protein
MLNSDKSMCTRWRLRRGTAITVLSVALGLGVISPVAAGAADGTTTPPDATAPDTTTPPDATPPDTPPDTAPPDTTEPPATPPDTTPPDTTEPPATPPDTTPPDTAEPPATPPDTTAPDTTAPPANKAPATPAPPATPATPAPGPDVSAQAVPTPFTASIRGARTSLTTAVVYLTNHQNTWAIMALNTLRVRLAELHQLGMAHIGPVKVVKVLGLEHQVAMKLLPPFNGLTNPAVVNALQTTLSTTFANRTAMLTKVIAVPEEGPVDYGDALADTLPIYGAEVRVYAAAVGQFQLTAPAWTALNADLVQVRATRQQFTKAFGGGE